MLKTVKKNAIFRQNFQIKIMWRVKKTAPEIDPFSNGEVKLLPIPRHVAQSKKCRYSGNTNFSYEIVFSAFWKVRLFLRQFQPGNTLWQIGVGMSTPLWRPYPNPSNPILHTGVTPLLTSYSDIDMQQVNIHSITPTKTNARTYKTATATSPNIT